MNIILLGPPGVGKGTQAKNIEQHFHIPQISTGDLLRGAIQSNSEMSATLKKTLETGALVSDEVISEILKQRVTEADCNNGFMLDGFPRTIGQANALKKFGINIDCVIEITLDDAAIIKRLSGRYIHASSGRTYHNINKPPKVPGKDDITGEPLTQRSDDKPEVIKKRLAVYYSQTAPLVEYYQNFDTENGKFRQPHYIQINGDQPIDSITQDIIDQISLIEEGQWREIE